MSCHGCAKEFNLFYKEHGCPSCGFSYCNKCLKYQCVVPKLGNKTHKVCRSCSSQVTGVEREPPAAFLNEMPSSQSIHDLPSIPSSFSHESEADIRVFDKQVFVILRRLESLEDPSRPPITIYKHDAKMEALKSGLEDPDRKIAERLEKLREDRKRGPGLTEEDIARRLAALRGEDPQRAAAKNKLSVLPESDNRTDAEKAESLIQQFMEERKITSKYPSPVEEISRRLARLRGEKEPESSESPESENVNLKLETMSIEEVASLLKQMESEGSGVSKAAKDCLKKIQANMAKKHSKTTEEEEASSEEDNEEECVQKIVEKVMKEAELNKKAGISDDESDHSSVSDAENKDELPWCIICNEDATLKCLGCDNDLYCNECFIKGHEEWNLTDHKTVDYKPPS